MGFLVQFHRDACSIDRVGVLLLSTIRAYLYDPVIRQIATDPVFVTFEVLVAFPASLLDFPSNADTSRVTPPQQDRDVDFDRVGRPWPFTFFGSFGPINWWAARTGHRPSYRCGPTFHRRRRSRWSALHSLRATLDEPRGRED